MDLFSYIPDKYVADVSSILNNDDWSKEQKLDFLKEIVDDSLLLKKCEDYIEAKNAAPASSPSSFILLLPQAEQGLANTFIQKEDIKALDKIIQNRKSDKKLKAAYTQWKNYYKEKKRQELIDGPLLCDTHVKFKDNNDLLQSLPNETNIVFLGGTGSGKTTQINALVNYLQFATAEEATKEKPTVLIPFTVTHYDEQCNEIRTFVKPTVATEAGSDANEVHEIGESATQSPRAYHIHYKAGKVNKLIRIIDTPGVGDTKGLDVEKLNMEKILTFLSQYEEIHAFCFTLKSNESRRTLAFKYCMNQLLIQLHHTAANNIMFCLTCAGGTQYTPGESFACLRAHAREVKNSRNVQINVNKETVHCFENDCYRHVCAVRANPKMKCTDEKKEMFASSWTHSVTSAINMLSRIAELRPHPLTDTVSIHNCRTVISALARPLAEIYRNQALNQRLAAEKMAKIEQCLREGKSLEGQLYMEEVQLGVAETDYPITVCTSPNCITYERLLDDGQRLKTVHKKPCHAHCYLRDTINNPLLKFCAAMGDTANGGEKCTVCGCDWNTHMHVYYKFTTEKKRVKATEVEQGLARNEQLKQRATLFLEKAKERTAELEAEKRRIRKYCAEIACFLKANALLHYNDKFGEYIELLIQDERGKVSAGALDDVLQDLLTAKEDYDHQVEIFTTDTSYTPKTLVQINRMIEELKDMKINGNILRDVQRIKLRYNKKAAIESVSSFSLEHSFKRIFSAYHTR